MEKFTYPFCYVPHPLVERAAGELIARIRASEQLHGLFAEGKMLGVLIVEDKDGSQQCLHAFSGLAGGRSTVDGFVPPIFDLTAPDGHFKKEEAAISELNARIEALQLSGLDADEAELVRLKSLRREMSVALQDWIFEQYKVHNALGECLSIREIFAAQGLVPPGGTGDCAAPKLLEYAYLHGLKPLAMGEFWYGLSPLREVRHQGSFYPSCMGKCGPLLPWMMRGLDVEPNPLDKGLEDVRIVYEDDTIIVVDKPSGIISVPGKTAMTSLLELLQKRAGDDCTIYSCHRLDMDTSGLMVFAKTPEAKSALERQFAEHRVEKSYLARLSAPASQDKSSNADGTTGKFSGPTQGRISLPLAPDWHDRPRQMADLENGKSAVTDYQILEALPNGELEVLFTPHTGRTHQLRVHAAHPLGLGRPIVGDRLYGKMTGERLCLHAAHLSFYHPVSGEKLHFNSEKPF